LPAGWAAVEPDRAAIREATKPLYDTDDSVWTEELRERIQAFQ
jgi:hypothetical protein